MKKKTIGTGPRGFRFLSQPLQELLAYFLKLGAFTFGGPIVLARHMQQDLVEKRKWVSQEEYLEGLAFAQLSPGPLATQLAMYLGWARFGALGATLAGFAFILPSFLMVLALAQLYIHYGSLPWVDAVFYGIGAAVIAIIAHSVHKLSTKTLGKDRFLWGIFLANGAVTAWTERQALTLFISCGVLTVVAREWKAMARSPKAFAAFPAFLMSGIHGPAAAGTLGKLIAFFGKAGALVFGSGFAIVPFLHGSVVQDFRWLTEQQFLDAVAVAMITPGPIVITVAFIGYLVAGVLGSCVSALAVFAPAYFFVILLAPYYRRFAKNKRIAAFVAGITSAAVGSIAGAAVMLGKKAVVDVPTVLIAACALAFLYSKKKMPEPLLIAISGLAGYLLKSRV